MENVQSLRLQGKNHEAWAAFKELTGEDSAEKAYERSILSFYVGIPKEEALLDFVRSYSKFRNTDYGNLIFYVIPFTCEVTPFPVPECDDFLPTSTSILPHEGRLLLNVRYVNYRIQSNGSYLMSEGGTLTPHHHLRTRNFFLLTDTDFSTFSPLEEIVPDIPPYHDRNIHGIEDIRLFRKGSTLHFSGTTCEYSHNGCIQQIEGVYDIQKKHLTSLSPMVSPKNTLVEKNWIPFNRAYEDDSRYIYSWHPLIIGRVIDGAFYTEHEISTPYFFRHVRGSTALVSYMNRLYTMVHCVVETCPRKYYHLLVSIDPVTFEIKYTVPYYFIKNHIEYTLGMYIAESTLTCIVSQNDCDPVIVRIRMDSLVWV
jgi:hypothetical protein